MGLSRGFDCSLSYAPSVWTASGDNRVYLWNVMNGECKCSLSVAGGKEEDDVVLNRVPIRVCSVVVGNHG